MEVQAIRGSKRLGPETQPGEYLPMGHVKFRQVRLGFGERLQPVLNDVRQAFALQDHRVSLRRLDPKPSRENTYRWAMLNSAKSALASVSACSRS